jgi:gluconolactonase
MARVFIGETGAWRAPIVFDNLIQQGAIPVAIGLFIDPGVDQGPGPAHRLSLRNRYNRSLEYDGLGGRYVRFLLEEILPEVGKQYKLSADPNDRAIGGSSSGGIAAFTAAWKRPDAFRRVASFVGSFTNRRGGDVYVGPRRLDNIEDRLKRTNFHYRHDVMDQLLKRSNRQRLRSPSGKDAFTTV